MMVAHRELRLFERYTRRPLLRSRSSGSRCHGRILRGGLLQITV
jgi:hypothetical protein